MVRCRGLVAAIVLVVLGASLATAQEPRRGPGRGGFGGRFGAGAGGGAMLLAMPEVQKELAISDEQKGLIEDMQADLREQMRNVFGNPQELGNLSQEERQKRFEESRQKAEEMGKKTEEMLKMILEPKQLERLSQLRLQTEGVDAFRRDEIAEKLGLTQDQKDKIAKIQEESRPDPNAFRNFRDASEEERRQAFAQMRERREKAQADILAVLTASQKESWEKMQGKKFDFPQRGFGGGRPGGERGRRQSRDDN